MTSDSQDGLSPLAHAAKEGTVDIVDMLLQKGAYVNMPDRVSHIANCP